MPRRMSSSAWISPFEFSSLTLTITLGDLMKCVVRSLSCAAVVIAATLAPLPADGGQDSTPKTIAVANGLSILAAEVEAAAAETLRSLALKKAQFEIEIQRERQSVLENALDSVLEER